MERYFDYERDITPPPESARDIIYRTDRTKIELEIALKRYIDALNQIVVETVGRETDKRVLVEAEKFRTVIAAKEQFEIHLAQLTEDMATLLKAYNAHDLEGTLDYIKVLMLKPFIQQYVDAFNAGTIPSNVDMV